MKNEVQGNQSSNSPTEHFWEKPIGKITISVIAGVIVFFIGFAINRHFAPKPSASEKSAEQTKKEKQVTTHDTPEKIISEINAVPPLQQEDVAKTYVGIPVEWELFFSSGFPTEKEYYLMFSPTPGLSRASVICPIAKSGNEHLKRLQEKTKMRVQGTIDKIDSGKIYLKNATVNP